MGLLPKNIEPDKYLGKGLEYLALSIFLIIIILGISFYAIITGSINLGELGSYLSGAIGSIIALLIAVFTFLAFYVQYDANKKIQEQFKVQQFESQFYKMLDIHIKNVEAFRISGFNLTNRKEIEIKGRDIFISLVKEYHYLLEIVYSFYKKPLCAKDKDLNWIAWLILFFGTNSNHLAGLRYNDSTHKSLIESLKDFQMFFLGSNGGKRDISIPELGEEEKMTNLNIQLEYIPFDGHESRLAHYYRHLYQTVKLVVEAEKTGIIDYQDSIRYLASLRAQLGNEEQQLLYYNYRYGHGKNWDKRGDKHKFLTKYRMAHNVPLDDSRLSEAIEHPRIHFKDYICKHASEEDSLFEWGDRRKELECSD
jgi:hypothetical protein